MLYTLYTKSYIHKVCRDSGTKCDRGMKLRLKARDSKCIMAASNKAAVTYWRLYIFYFPEITWYWNNTTNIFIFLIQDNFLSLMLNFQFVGKARSSGQYTPKVKSQANWTKAETFDICIFEVSDRYCQYFICREHIWNKPASTSNFDVPLVSPSFLSLKLFGIL